MSAVVATALTTTGAQTLENQSYKPRANYEKEIVRFRYFPFIRLFKTKFGCALC
jgi:hypothetical protein